MIDNINMIKYDSIRDKIDYNIPTYLVDDMIYFEYDIVFMDLCTLI